MFLFTICIFTIYLIYLLNIVVFLFINKQFNIALANSYHLSIQLGISHLSYCMLNTTTFTYDYAKIHTLSSIDDNASEITEIINNDTIIISEFSSEYLFAK